MRGRAARSSFAWRGLTVGQRGKQPGQTLLVRGGKLREPLTLPLSLFAHRLAECKAAMLGQLEPD